MTDEVSRADDYRQRTYASLEKHCSSRGIPEPEFGSVRAAIAEQFGKTIDEMIEPELRNVNRELPYILIGYLEGAKRRPMPAASVPEDGAGTFSMDAD